MLTQTGVDSRQCYDRRDRMKGLKHGGVGEAKEYEWGIPRKVQVW